MMKKTAAIILSLAFMAGAFAFDFGGTISDTSRLGTADLSKISLYQNDTITGWFRTPIPAVDSLYFATEATAGFTFNAADLTNITAGEASAQFDLTLLKLGYSTKLDFGTLQAAFGRFFISDSTGIILAQNNDGLYASLAADRFNLTLYGGYTGLLNAKTVSILGSATKKFSYNAQDFYAFNNPYFTGLVGFSMPYVFMNQTFGAEFIIAAGLPGLNGNDNTGYNRYYFTLSANGPIVKNLFYTCSTTVSSENFENLSNLTKATLSFYPGVLSAAVNANAVFASGYSSSQEFTSFRAISSSSAAYSASEPEYSGLLKIGADGSIKPVKNLLANAGMDAIFTSRESLTFNGFQVYGGAKWQPFSDLSVGTSFSQYFGTSAGSSKTAFTVNVVMSF